MGRKILKIIKYVIIPIIILYNTYAIEQFYVIETDKCIEKTADFYVNSLILDILSKDYESSEVKKFISQNEYHQLKDKLRNKKYLIEILVGSYPAYTADIYFEGNEVYTIYIILDEITRISPLNGLCINDVSVKWRMYHNIEREAERGPHQ